MDEWKPIETAPLGDQILVWEKDYGWLIALRDFKDRRWLLKSSGNFYFDMPESVANNLSHWARLQTPPE